LQLTLPCNHSEQRLLQSASTEITKVNVFVNTAKATAERLAKLFELQNSIWNENVALMDSNRSFIGSGELLLRKELGATVLGIGSTPKLRTVLLFNDVLIIVKKQSRALGSSRTLCYIFYYDFEYARISSVTVDGNEALQMNERKTTFTFIAEPAQPEQRAWLDTIRRTIVTYHSNLIENEIALP
jgi:hypothetical protein